MNESARGAVGVEADDFSLAEVCEVVDVDVPWSRGEPLSCVRVEGRSLCRDEALVAERSESALDRGGRESIGDVSRWPGEVGVGVVEPVGLAEPSG